jgi:GT2 family glycosyltransferase
MHTAPSVSVIIAAFADERWGDLVEAVDSVSVQSHPAQETIVVIDHNARLLSKARAELPGARVLENEFARGASGARNTGVAASTSYVVAFLDDDACADPRWLEHLVRPFDDARVIGVGGRLAPAWSSRRPRWFAPEFDWVVGASYRGMPERLEPIRNVWSNNMAIRRDIFDAIGGFRLGFGKTGARSRPEDTDLCLRAGKVRAGTCWAYQPAALAHHKVPAARERFGFFVRRCFAEGQGKAELGALVDRSSAMSSERAYARTVLPKGLIAGLGETMRGDPMGLARSGVIVLGLGAATAGLVSELCVQQFGRSGDRPEGADAHPR